MKTIEKPRPTPRGHSQEAPSGFSPKTLLGKRLWALRQKYIADGGKLLDWEKLDAEATSRKGSAAEHG